MNVWFSTKSAFALKGRYTSNTVALRDPVFVFGEDVALLQDPLSEEVEADHRARLCRCCFRVNSLFRHVGIEYTPAGKLCMQLYAVPFEEREGFAVREPPG